MMRKVEVKDLLRVLCFVRGWIAHIHTDILTTYYPHESPPLKNEQDVLWKILHN